MERTDELIKGRLTGRAGAAGAAGLIALLVLAGCAGKSAPAAEDTATSAASTPTPTPTPTPTATAGITLDGIGDLKIGGSFAAAGTQLGVTPDSQCPAILADKASWMTWVGAKRDGTTVSDTIDLVAIDAWGYSQPPAATPRTDKGIGLGSSLADVKAAYPTATSSEEPNVDFTLRYSEGPRSMVFQGRSEVVQAIQILPAADPVSSEFCG